MSWFWRIGWFRRIGLRTGSKEQDGPTPQARLDEIASWLQQRMSVAEAVAEMSESDRYYGSRGTPMCDALERWIAAYMREEDELWRYDTGEKSWTQLAGEMGFALVRGGAVVEFFTIEEN